MQPEKLAKSRVVAVEVTRLAQTHVGLQGFKALINPYTLNP